MKKSLRIISLAPTQTEILAALGLIQELAGVTSDCDYPNTVRALNTYGGWWEPDLRRIIDDKPDLVCTFGQRQESIGGVLQAFGFQGAVLHQDAGTIAEAISNIQDVGIATDVEDIAKPLCTHLKKRIQKVRRQVAAIQYDKRPRVLRIMHWEPLISVGPGSFQHDVIEKAGGVNLTGDGTQPYSCCKPEVIIQRDPEVIFFCGSEILARLREDPQWQGVAALRHGRLHQFDCGLTCRSGPRIVDMLEGLARVLLP